MRRYIQEGLENYIARGMQPWHMPGHKRKGLYTDVESVSQIDTVLDMLQTIDVTELPDTDDLHRPEGMIGASLKELARVYDTVASFYLVGGATCGVLAGITACAQSGKKHILMARNCHSSVYNAAQLLKLTPIYIDPPFAGEGLPHLYGGVTAGQVKEQLEELPRETRDDLCCAVLTSPTYEGILSDIQGIANVVHGFHIPLVVDEAHGAHLPFMPETEAVSAMYLGADITVQSLHKTMPAMTQTALLHVQSEALLEQVRKYISIYMSSSPSYPMLLSMERAVARAEENSAAFSDYYSRLKAFRKRTEDLSHIKLFTAFDANTCASFAYDETRLVLYAKDSEGTLVPGTTLRNLLSTEKIECEMAGPEHVTLISTVMDTETALDTLYAALSALDRTLPPKVKGTLTLPAYNLSSLLGKVSDTNIYAYPPGSYIVSVGEVITAEAVAEMKSYANSGIQLYGLL